MPYKHRGIIEVERKTRERLDRHRDYDETWDQLLNTLLNLWNRHNSVDTDTIQKPKALHIR